MHSIVGHPVQCKTTKFTSPLLETMAVESVSHIRKATRWKHFQVWTNKKSRSLRQPPSPLLPLSIEPKLLGEAIRENASPTNTYLPFSQVLHYLRLLQFVLKSKSLLLIQKRQRKGFIATIARYCWWNILAQTSPYKFRVHITNSYWLLHMVNIVAITISLISTRCIIIITFAVMYS